MKGRNIISSFILILSLLLLTAQARSGSPGIKDQPNILIIMTDQQSADAMSFVMGKEYIHTPHMDQLAEKGFMFTRAYSPNPLCKPMRTSMLTGRFPHENNVLSNEKAQIDPSKNLFLGKIFKDAGYETAYFGKWHVAYPRESKDVHGFDILMEKEGRLDTDPAIAYLQQKHKKPFLMMASFLSPHEICQWARFEDLPGGPIGDVPELEQLPPLKPNFDPPENETAIMQYMRRSYQSTSMLPVADYTEYDWRRLAWGYYRLIERADQFVGEIMEALDQSEYGENTLVVFLSDHGDCAGSHRWNQKTVFYDESTRVPFILAGNGISRSGSSETLMNLGTDIIPTLCDFAGISIPEELPGKSIRGALVDSNPIPEREFIVVENQMVQGAPVDGISLEPQGRMVRSRQFKYCIYSEGEQSESLVDMENDPLEMVNLAQKSEYKKILKEHRSFLLQHAKQHQDKAALEMLARVN